MDAAAATQGDAEEALQAPGDLAVGQAGLLVEFDDGGLGVGSELGGGGPEGVGSLQGVASLHASPTLPAMADVDVELPMNGLARDFDLELLGDVGFVEGPPQSGQASGNGASWVSSICSAGRGAVALGP